MKVYRVYGACEDWECSCEKTIRTFASKEDAQKFEDCLSKKDIIHLCGFCVQRSRYSEQIHAKGTIVTDIEELEVE